jgi:arsenite methyltransferase
MAVTLNLDLDVLRGAIRHEYEQVATCPTRGFHFHTGRPLAERLGYPAADIAGVPAGSLESFAGVGNPYVFGRMRLGETVLDVGSGAGLDSLIAARQVGPTGRVIGVDMTDAMLDKARAGARAAGLDNVEFRKGVAEELPLGDTSVDVVISNGVLNLCPDKEVVYREIFRVLEPGGRFQIADIVVEKEVPREAKENIELWTG